MITNSHTSVTPATLPSQLLRISDVVALTTLSKSCVNLWVAQGRFPKPIALSSTLKVWRSSDLSDWIDKQFNGADVLEKIELAEETPRGNRTRSQK